LRGPIDTQTPLRGDLTVPLVPVVRATGDILDGHLASLLHVGAAVVFGALVVVAFVRLPRSHAALALAMFVVAVSAERLTSIERYALGAVPIVVAAATLIGRPAVERATFTLVASAMVGLTVLAWLGAYTP
jgi:hypothetical protein